MCKVSNSHPKVLKETNSIINGLNVMLTVKTTLGGYYRYGVVLTNPYANRFQKVMTCRTILEAWKSYKRLAV